MIGSLYTGISGLKANTSAMCVIGDNIANVDTTGFKSSRCQFSNVFNAVLGQSKMEIGRGVQMSGTTANWNAGTLETTNNVTDLAINGTGMFIVRDADNGGEYYSRAGQFEFDRSRVLVNQDNMQVQGRAINFDGSTGSVGAISLPDDVSAPNATTEVTMGLNLDSSTAVGDTFNTTVTVYDSLGNSNELTFEFERTAAGWDYYVTPSTGTATPATAARNSIAFDSDGAYDATASIPAATSHSIVLAGLAPATTPMTITWSGMDTDVTGYTGNSVKTNQTQDGYPSGLLQSISVDEDGVFSALYSNGTVSPFSQLILADFASYSGLSKQGSNLFLSTLASGQANYLTPNEAGVGAIAPNSLEMSNVDLATEFVELITTQRGFQANSKVITTSDEVLSDLINIKR